MDGAAHLPNRPVGGVQLLGKVPSPRIVVVAAVTAGVFHAGETALGQLLLPVVGAHAELVASLLVDDRLVEPDPISLGEHVELAHGDSVIAGVAEARGERRDVRHRLPLLEHAITVGPGREPRHQGAARGDARGAGRVGVGIPRTVLCELGDGRRHDHGVPGRAREQTGPVVGADEQHVRSTRCHGALLVRLAPSVAHAAGDQPANRPRRTIT